MLVGHVRDDHVEAVVDDGLALGLVRPRRRARRAAPRPSYWIAKSTIVVVPPCAAAIVPDLEVVGRVVPPNGMSRCVCTSMPPGMTYLPAASIVVSAAVPAGNVPTAAICSPSIEHVRAVRIRSGHDRAVPDDGSHRRSLVARISEFGRRAGLTGRVRRGSPQQSGRAGFSCAPTRTSARSRPSCRCRTRTRRGRAP